MSRLLGGIGRNPHQIVAERLAERRRRREAEDAAHKTEDRRIRQWICLSVAFFSYFIFWFDDPQLTSGAMLFLAVSSLIALAYMLHHDILRALYIFTAYISFQKVLAGDFGGAVPMLNATNVLLVMMIAAWVSRSFLRGERVFQLHIIDVLIFIYTLFLVLAMLRSEFRHVFNALGVFTNFKRLTEVYFVYFLFVNNIHSRRQIMHILFVVCVVMGAVGIMGVKQYYMDIGGGSFSNMDKNKITILADQPNQLASYLCNYSFYLLAVFFAFWKRWWGVGALILFIACFQSTRVTFSRGGLLAFYCATLVVLVMALRVKVLLLLIPLMLVTMAFPQKVLGPRLYRNYVAVFSAPTAVERLNLPQQGGEPGIDSSAMSRLWIIQAGLRRIRRDPNSMLFGVGLGLFPIETAGYHPKIFYLDAHNQWLLILVECGSIALATMWMILAICAWRAIVVYLRTTDPLYRAISIGYMGGLAGLFVANFFGSRMNSNEIIHFHWIMTAVLMRVDWMVRYEVAERQELMREARREALGL